MFLLVAGVVLWIVAHLFRRVAPDFRASLGWVGRAIVGVAVVISITMMTIGYSSAENTVFWGRSPALVGINNLLVLLAFYLMSVALVRSALAGKMRHLVFTAVKTWAIAHLLVNGDVASFVLFGGLFAWALISVIVINRTAKPEKPVVQFSWFKEIAAILLAVGAFGAVAWLHLQMGYPVFG